MLIEPLSKQTLRKTIRLAHCVFKAEGKKKYPEFAYKASLGIEPYKTQLKSKFGTNMVQYWVALDGNRIVGTVGLYHMSKERSTKGWLGWFCVGKRSRGKGIGKALLRFAIKEARKAGFKKLWLYTDPKGEEAQILYEKMGFKKKFTDGHDLFRMKEI